MVIRKKKTSTSKSRKPVKKSEPVIKQSKVLAPFEELERLFDDYLNRNWLRSFRPVFPRLDDLWGTYEMHSPNLDVIDRDNEVIVRAELPGVDKKDLDITVSENALTIKGTSSMESTREEGNYYRSECKKGSFSRSIGLPADVDSSKIKATFNNGLLELTAPKVAKSVRKKIRIT